ncbi:MAG: hypothetical protein JKY32_00395 [Rhizobiales bacterium]|nr:hypothetical protein [Hyphomicrobiales bacterium]
MLDAHFPGRPQIDAYGNGGFRFADMSHKGSILILPSGVYAWTPGDIANFQIEDFTQILAEASGIDFLLLGTGDDFVPVSQTIHTQIRAKGINLDIMSTGAAARIWNVVLGEGRRFAAAFVAVD